MKEAEHSVKCKGTVAELVVKCGWICTECNEFHLDKEVLRELLKKDASSPKRQKEQPALPSPHLSQHH